MAEVLVAFSEPVLRSDGASYMVRACGAERPDGLWHGWLEFTSSETDEMLRSGRETTQPNRQDLVYWATGLTPVYLEGALHRTLLPTPTRTDTAPAAPSILNPFSVYRKGEPLLRRQLEAFSRWHLVNIIRDHALSEQDEDALDRLTEPQLIELIVAGVRMSVEREAG